MNCVLAVIFAISVSIGLARSFAADTSQSRVTTIIANDRAPGVQVVFVSHGKILYHRAFGVRDLTTGAPVDKHTRFEIGSITKQFTAAAILQLKNQRKLALSDPLGKYIPEYQRGKSVTLKQMLWHVSGIPDYTRAKGYEQLIVARDRRPGRSKDLGLPGVLAFIHDKPLDFTPGSGMEYSNTNYYLLGQVISLVSGMSWEQYIRKHLFQAAQMADSSFIDDEPRIRDMATGYTSGERGVRKPIASRRFISPGGAGAIVSTAEDLARWDQALFGGRIISRGDLDLMTAPGPRPLGDFMAYGFGWAIEHYNALMRLSHDGVTPGFSANTQVYRALSQYVIVLTNGDYAHPGVIADVAFNQFNPSLAAKANSAVPGARADVTSAVRELIREMRGGSLKRVLFTDRMYKFAIGNRKFLQQGYEYLGNATSLVYQGKIAGPRPLHKYRLLYDTGAVLKLSVAVTAADKIDGLTFWIQ